MTDNPIIPQKPPETQGNGAGIDFGALLNAHFATDTAGTFDGAQHGTQAGAAAPTAADAESSPAFWRAGFSTFQEFLKRPRKSWLVDTVFHAHDFVLLYGESGHGKTHAALDLAFACVTGGTFADKFAVERPLSVAYCTGEGTDGVVSRLATVSEFYGTQDVPLYPFVDIPQLFQPAVRNGALGFIVNWKQMAAEGLVPATLDVLILDTMHNSTAGADENSAKDAGIVQATMRRLRDELGCAIVLVHHAGKSGANERGSSAIRASADTVLRATKNGNSYTLTCEKLKDGTAWAPQGFHLVCPPGNPDGVRVAWAGDALKPNGDRRTHADKALEFLQEHAGLRYTAAAIADALGLQGATAKNLYRDLNELKRAGSVQSETVGKQPAQWYVSAG